MIYLLAGHTPKGLNQDPGAIGVNKLREADLTMQLRDDTADILRSMGYKVWEDEDTQRIAHVLKQINSNEKDVIIDIHFNAAANPSATGCEVIMPERHTQAEFDMGRKLSTILASVMQIRNRGVKPESATARGRIGSLNQPKGLNLLLETCFITNPVDVSRYQTRYRDVAQELALIIAEAENLMV